MKNLALAGALSLALAVSGCTSFINASVSDINAVTTALSTPQAQQAIATLKSAYGGIVCGVGTLASLTAAVAADVKATKTVQGATIVAMTSVTLCTSIGGVVAAQ